MECIFNPDIDKIAHLHTPDYRLSAVCVLIILACIGEVHKLELPLRVGSLLYFLSLHLN